MASLIPRFGSAWFGYYVGHAFLTNRRLIWIRSGLPPKQRDEFIATIPEIKRQEVVRHVFRKSLRLTMGDGQTRILVLDDPDNWIASMREVGWEGKESRSDQ
jgi:hypothetical protein